MKFTFHLLTLSYIFLICVSAGDELSIYDKEQKAKAFHATFFVEQERNYLNTAITDYFYYGYSDLNLDCCDGGLHDPDRHEKRFTKARINKNSAIFWEKLTELTWLRSLNLSEALNGELPRSINSLLRLSSLDLSCNNLRILPSSIGELSAHCKINLAGNPLLSQRGEDESVWGREELIAYFGTNVQLPPSLPNVITSSPNYGMRVLDLHDNASAKQCIDADPAVFWKKLTRFKKLQRLNLSGMLNGKLPSTISSFLELVHLNLSRNKLKTLSSSIGKLSAQCIVNLEDNPLLQQGDDEAVWGRDELTAYFGSNVRFS